MEEVAPAGAGATSLFSVLRGQHRYARAMTKSSVWTIVGVIVAVVIAWVLLDVVLKLAFLLVKVALVVVIAAVVFFALRSMFARRSD